jgi:hypothetical protein
MSLPLPKRRRKDDDSASSSAPANYSSVVLIHRQSYAESEKEDPPPALTLNSDLGDFIHPMTNKSFLENCFRKRAVHVTCEQGQEETHLQRRVASLREEMCNLDAETILRETSSDNIFLWLQQKRVVAATKDTTSNNNNQNLIQSIEVSDVKSAIALHLTAGHATYCRAPPKVEQCLVSNLLRGTGLGCGQYDPSGESMVAMGRGEVETFISTDGHVTNWHFDFQENFTIQLSGIKRWTLQQGTLKDPIRGCTPHYASPESVESQLKVAHLCDRKFRFGYPEKGVNATGDRVTIDVKPGDVLYFPAGMWHMVETIEPGVSINVSLMASNYATVTCQALQHFLLKDEKWREPVLNNETTNVVENLKQLLKELPDQIRELEREGRGAEAILPPVLQYPPKFEMGNEDEAWETVDEREDNDEDDDDNIDEHEEEEKEEHGQYGSDDDETSNDILDPMDFDEYPKEWDFHTCTTKLTRNPLACLTRLDEVSSFYEGKKPRDESLFVLNFNYAGNEMHQSTVRKVFRVKDVGLANLLFELERHPTVQVDLHQGKESCNLAKFLVFHGYFQQA